LVAGGVKRLAAAAWLLAACATAPASDSAIEPTLGHYQPLPKAIPSADEPAPGHQPPPASNDTADTTDDSPMLPTPEEDALCRHIVKLVQSESPDEATAEQTDELTLNCGFALAHDRRRMGKEEFERRAACMRAATAVADFAACAPEPAPSDPPR
jgi:hypothetical protein